MNACDVTIRAAREHERDEILSVHLDAFGDEEGPVIAKLVGELLDDPTSRPIDSLVAESDGHLVGHVLFTAVTVEPDEAQVRHLILAPLAVVTEKQSLGIGARLVREGFRRHSNDEAGLIFVLGYPDYYLRFGFQPAGPCGFLAPYPIADEHADAWMVRELVSGAIERHKGIVRCSKALDHPQYWRE